MSNQDEDGLHNVNEDPQNNTEAQGEVRRNTFDSQIAVLDNSYGKPGKKVLRANCNERWDGSSVMCPPVPNQQRIDLITIDSAAMTDTERQDQDMRMEYEAEVTVYRVLEKLRENCVVLHGVEFKHLLYEQVFSYHSCTSDKCRRSGDHACHNEKRGLEGETDFLVIGKNYFAIIEVKHCKPENIEQNLRKGKNQADKAAKFLKRIIEIYGNDADMNPVFQFYAFPFLQENEARKYLEYALNENTCQNPVRGEQLLFEDVLINFQPWWMQNVETRGRGYEPISENVKSVVIGIVGTAESFDMGKCIIKIDENLRKSKITRENKKGHPVLNNAQVHETCNEMKILDISYIRDDQKTALDCDDKVVILNGPAGVGKTVIMLTKLMQMANDPSFNKKIVLFTIGNQAALFHESCIIAAGIACCLKRIRNDTRIEDIESLIQSTSEDKKVLIFSITIFSFPIEFLGRINTMVELLKDHCIFMDDVQYFILPSSTKTSLEYYSNVSQKFQELLRTLNECSFARIAIDAAQLFYYPSSEGGISTVAEALNSITAHARIVTLQSNLRNSYEMSRLLAVVRKDLRGEFPNIDRTLMSTQNFSHYIHGAKPVIHVLSSSQRAKLSDKIVGVTEREFALLGVGALGRRNTIENDKVRVLEFKNIKDFEVADSHKMSEKLRNIMSSGTDIEMIRNCYSREWAAVIALICPCNMTYKEFLSRVYLAASRARVYCSLIFFMRESKPPPFFSRFLDSVESSDTAIIKKYNVKQDSVN